MGTTALIIETNNLASLEEHGAVVETLAELFEHLANQTFALQDLDELVVTHQGLSASGRAEVADRAGREIRWVELDPTTGYYAAKRAGFDATSSDVVVFGDSDCWPVSDWLSALVEPFADPEIRAVSGRTTYTDDVVGIAATAIDFFFVEGLRPGTVRNFYANNVAFRRDVFARFGYGTQPGVYRGHCQVMGMRMWEAQIPIHFAPDARTIHELADTVREFTRLRLYRGSDTAALGPQFVRAYGGPARHVARVRAASVAAVLLARFGLSQRRLNRQAMEPVRGVRKLGARAVIGAISAIDTVGAGLALAGRDLGVVDGNARREVRAYHVVEDKLKLRGSAPTAAERAA